MRVVFSWIRGDFTAALIKVTVLDGQIIVIPVKTGRERGLCPQLCGKRRHFPRMHIPANTKHLYNICTKLNQRRRRWVDVVQMFYKCFVFAGNNSGTHTETLG